jgi:hypothetical protein
VLKSIQVFVIDKLAISIGYPFITTCPTLIIGGDIMYEDVVNEGEVLTKKHTYILYRPSNKMLPIDIHEILTGPNTSKFFAEPTLLVKKGRHDYVSVSDTEIGALKDCLLNIMGLSDDDFIDSDSDYVPDLI